MFESVIIILAVLAFLAAVFLQGSTLLTLRQHNRDYYQRLGEPPAFFVSPLKIGAAFSLFVYIIAGEFRNDDIPAAAADAFPTVRLLYFVFFSLLILLLIKDVAF